ncbi:MAG: hypothetical protein PVF46_06595 [Lysobacterales bacterium]|jgi:hypothetical protein
MNWLQDNPVGKVLVYTSGGLLLLAVILTIVWSLPVQMDRGELAAEEGGARADAVVAREIASLNELQVINQRPLFNENRLPVVDDVEVGAGTIDTTIEVKDAPDVKLTGIIITPEMKIATLTPASGSAENVMAHEGEALVGEYVGWSVAEVNARTVALRSNDGQQMLLELQVHDVAIKEPPKPVATAAVQEAAAVAAAQAEAAAAAQPPPVGEDGQPLSRAEQIRQRIAERREQLRQEQEAREAQLQKEQAPGGRQNYQNAIRDMMNRSRNNNDSTKDGNG